MFSSHVHGNSFKSINQQPMPLNGHREVAEKGFSLEFGCFVND
jgi:hypothetical protein